MPSTKKIWITGASQGIGRGLLAHYRSLGWRTLGTARSSVAPPEADVWIPADLTHADQRIDAVNHLLVHEEWPDLVILNAGMGHWGAAEATQYDVAQRVFALNYWAPVELTRLLAAHANGRALHVVVIGSIAARFGQKNLATYSASKAALNLWAESINEEWQGSANQIQLIHPGVVTTDIMRRSIGPDGEALGARAGTHIGWSVGRTARAIERATRSGRFAHILASPSVRFALILHDLCPRIFYLLLRRKP